MKTAAIKVRRISVKVGDVFGVGGYALLVEELAGSRATVRNADTGRRTKVQVLRLQVEYPRASEKGAASAIRQFRRIDERLARRQPRKAAR